VALLRFRLVRQLLSREAPGMLPRNNQLTIEAGSDCSLQLTSPKRRQDNSCRSDRTADRFLPVLTQMLLPNFSQRRARLKDSALPPAVTSAPQLICNVLPTRFSQASC
jgi:hypothetical protein